MSKLQIFSKAAHNHYIKNTTKTYEDLQDNGYLGFYRYSWADGLSENDWDSIEEAEICGIESANQALNQE